MTKAYRQGQILKLIRSKRISTQEELAQELRAQDIAATGLARVVDRTQLDRILQERSLPAAPPRPMLSVSDLPFIDFSLFDVDIYIDNAKEQVSDPLPRGGHRDRFPRTDRAERQGKLCRPCCNCLGRGSHEARRALIRFSARQGGCALLLAGRDERQLTQSGKSEQLSNDLQSAARLVFCSVGWRYRRSPRSR